MGIGIDTDVDIDTDTDTDTDLEVEGASFRRTCIWRERKEGKGREEWV